MEVELLKQKVIEFLALFTSTGTLLCCALPAAIAAVAGGAAVGVLLSSFPFIITLSKYKTWLFLFAGILIVLNGILIFQPKGKIACRITGGKGCDVASQFSKRMFLGSLFVYLIGFFFAFAIVPIMEYFG